MKDGETLKYVKIVWLDHVGYDNSGWQDYDEEALTKMAEGITCVTVGPLLMETDTSYVVGNTVTTHGQISNALAIIKTLVKEVYYLETVPTPKKKKSKKVIT